MAVRCRHGKLILKTRLAFITGLLASVLCVTALAQSYKPFPGETVNPRTRAIQERVEAIYSAGDFERALLIYEKDLAPLGDKYAQYMVGFMHETGIGVDEDPLQASAWYRLAAERGNPQFRAVRDQLIITFSEVDRIRSDYLFLELRKDYSDVAILMGLIREDLDRLDDRTGSRTGTTTSPITILDPRRDATASADEFFARLRSRTQARLRYLAMRLGDDSVSDNVDDVDMTALETLVSEHMDTISDLDPVDRSATDGPR